LTGEVGARLARTGFVCYRERVNSNVRPHTVERKHPGGTVAFDADLADRIRHQLSRRRNFTEKKMFGGICFLLNGNMCCGVLRNELIIRVRPGEREAILQERYTRVFDFSGRPSKNMVYVGTKALEKDAELKRWLQITLEYVRSLPPKP
jgi:TfoX/Sxy family transcriptional regulator of competence genes